MNRSSVVIALLTAACALRHAEIPVAARGLKVNTTVSLVKIFGHWEHGDHNGYLRLVVTKACSPEHCFDRAYLQWVESVPGADRRYARAEVLKVVPIQDLGDAGVVQAIRRAPTASDPNRFELHLENTYTAHQGVLCITPADPGHYSASQAACPPAA